MTEEFQHLTEGCGHHCGAHAIGKASMNVGHCDCPECHGEFIVRLPDVTP